MKYKKSFVRNFYLCTLFSCFCFIKGKSQDSSKIKPITYYRITVGGGLGKGYLQSELGFGLSGIIEIAVQKQKSIYAINATSLYALSPTSQQELGLFNFSNVRSNISTVNIMYGRVLSSNNFFCSISAGVGYVFTEEKGAIISREGGWLFGINTYEKLNHSTIGVPISLKTFWVPVKFYGIGIDFNANINSKSSFYSVNFCHQIGKLRAAKKKKK